MSETLIIPDFDNKDDNYKLIYQQAETMLGSETNRIANMANLCAILKYGMHFFWVGFYLVVHKELVLSVFQGPVACTRIAFGKGVCGKAWSTKQTLIVKDVEKFEGHIACSSLSKSEIVVPLFDHNNNCYGVLDVDSDKLNFFDQTDQRWLEKLVRLI